MGSTEDVHLSTITPVYRGASHLEALVEELAALRLALQRGRAPISLLEAIFVDDGSTDGSAQVLARLAEQHSWVRVLSLSRNFGQHSATAAGILHCSGDWVATLDEDLQHRPRFLLPMLVHAIRGELDVVYAKPDGAVHGSLVRNLSSRSTKSVLAWVAGNPGVADFNSFRMLRGSIARAAAAVSRQETYFDVALYWFSDRVGALPLEIRDPRRQAESGYSFRSLLDHARRLLISSQVRPFRMGAVAGLGALGASVTGAAAVVALKMFRPGAIDLPGWASLIVVTLFFGGLLCLLIGIALEYLSSLYQQELGKPTFFVVDRSRDALLAELGSLRFDDDPADS